MRKLYFILFTLLVFFNSGFTQVIENCLDQNADQIMDLYWNYQNQFEEHFINFPLDEYGNLTSDGIGIWNDDKLQYSEAGMSLPATHINLPGNLVSGNEFQSGVGLGADCTISLGQLMANLSMQYDLHLKAGNTNNARITLNKIFLCLQAYRRLDMTANRITHIFLTETQLCGYETAKNPDVPLNVTGYTGWFLRDDMPWGFTVNNDCNEEEEYLCIQNGPFGSYNRFFNFAQKQFCDDCGSKTDRQRLCSLGHDKWTKELNCGTTDPCDVKFNLDIRNFIFMSQDQMNGILYGLSYIKRFVPKRAFVELIGPNGQISREYPLNIAQKIAEGIIKTAETGANSPFDSMHSLKYGLGPHEKLDANIGANTSAVYRGMVDVYNYINDDDRQFSLFQETAYNSFKTIIDNGLANVFDTRTWVKQSIVTGSNYPDVYNYSTLVNYHTATLEQLIFNPHQKDDIFLFFSECVEPSDNTIPELPSPLISLEDSYGNPLKCWENNMLPLICEELTNADCSLPCFLDGDYTPEELANIGFECTNTGSSSFFKWCHGGPLSANQDNCDDIQTSVQSPLDIIHFINVLLQNGYMNLLENPYQNPAYIEATNPPSTEISSGPLSMWQTTEDLILGDNELCGSGDYYFNIENDDLSNYDISVSTNLEIDNIFLDGISVSGLENGPGQLILTSKEVSNDSCIEERVIVFDLEVFVSDIDYSINFESDPCRGGIQISLGGANISDLVLMNPNITLVSTPPVLGDVFIHEEIHPNNINFGININNPLHEPPFFDFNVTFDVLLPCGELENHTFPYRYMCDDDYPIIKVSTMPNPIINSLGTVKFHLVDNSGIKHSFSSISKYLITNISNQNLNYTGIMNEKSNEYVLNIDRFITGVHSVTFFDVDKNKKYSGVFEVVK